MCENQFARSELLLGSDSINKLKDTYVAVFGIGGVGGYVVEALARSGVGKFHLIDNDTVNITNINRQIIATHDTIGRYKVDVMKERILSIYPYAKVKVSKCFYLPENANEFEFSEYQYVVDAIDTVTGKIQLVMKAKEANIPIISCMGAGNKLDPTKFVVTDIYKTQMCPLAKVMRKELRARGVESLKVVYSTEQAKQPTMNEQPEIELAQETRRSIPPGSVAFVPSVAGLIVASEVILDISNTIYNCDNGIKK